MGWDLDASDIHYLLSVSVGIQNGIRYIDTILIDRSFGANEIYSPFSFAFLLAFLNSMKIKMAMTRVEQTREIIGDQGKTQQCRTTCRVFFSSETG